MAAPLYAADPKESLRAVTLDGLSLLFHVPSGTTHIVAPPAPEILAALQRGPADVAELLHRLRAEFEVEGDALQARLDELEEAGLVRRA